MGHYWTKLCKTLSWPSWNIVFRRKYHRMPNAFNRFKVKGAGIIICNHNHWIEGPLTAFTFVGRQPFNLMSIKVISSKRRERFFTKVLNTIIIDNENLKWGDINKIISKLEKGELVLIFPEGKVSPPHSLNQFNNGVATLAYLTKTPIYPMYMYPDHNWKHTQHIVLGEKICLHEKFTKMDSSTINEMTKMLYNYMLSMKQKVEDDIKK